MFIYDASAFGQVHAIVEAALMELEHVIDVVLVSRLRQLPPPEPKGRKPAGAPQQGCKSATSGSEPPHNWVTSRNTRAFGSTPFDEQGHPD